MELILWFLALIIYAAAALSGHTGRTNNFGRYGAWGIMDFSPGYNPLEQVRSLYEDRLKIYYQHNQPKDYLINKNCEARLIKSNNGKIYFYCKERSFYKSAGSYFEVNGDSEHAATMWAIIDMEFNELTRYSDIRELYYSLNQGFETRGGLIYYHEPIFNKLPKPVLNKSAQNEFCRMYIQKLSNGEKVLFCTEIWGVTDYDKPRVFFVKGNKLILYGILSDFSKEKNKMQDYLTILYKVSQYKGCTVKEINPQMMNNMKPEQMLNEQLNKQEKEPEPIQYIHVDLSEEKIEEKNTEINKNDNTIDLELPTKTNEEEQPQKIEKYNERNLDL